MPKSFADSSTAFWEINRTYVWRDLSTIRIIITKVSFFAHKTIIVIVAQISTGFVLSCSAKGLVKRHSFVMKDINPEAGGILNHCDTTTPQHGNVLRPTITFL